MKTNLQDACLELGICVIDKSEAGNFIVYGLPSVVECATAFDAIGLSRDNFEREQIAITKRADKIGNG